MSRGTRQHSRRLTRLAARRCLTVAEAYALNEQRRLPADHPSLGERTRTDRPSRPRMAFTIQTSAEHAWAYLKVIRSSPEARRVCEWLSNHPGPKSRCTGEVLLLAAFLAADIKGTYLRSELCAVINGLDATILFHLGLCDTTTIEPVSYSMVARQVKRLERVPFAELMQESLGQNTSPKDGPGANAGLLWFNQGLLLASIPKRVREKITAVALDATAFATNARVQDYRKQADVDQLLRDSLLNGTPLPEGLIVGPDGKIQRCKADPQARTGVRGASRATNHKKAYFTGYMATTVAASLDLRDHPDPERVPPEEAIGPYILSFSLDPATVNRAPVGRDVLLSLADALPNLNIVSADREFTVRPGFVLPVHKADIDVIMDYPEPVTSRPKIVSVGRRQERLYLSCGDFFPLKTPKKFLKPPSPKHNSPQVTAWATDRAKYRYVPNGPSRNGTIQLLCPQCAGNVIIGRKTRMGKHKGSLPPGVPSLPTRQLKPWCCNGSISIRAEERNQHQSLSWGSEPHRDFYSWGRSRIENSNGLVKHEGGMDPRACEASDVEPHSMTVLALTVANNVSFAAKDPRSDPPADDCPKAEASLFCVTPALHSTNGTSNGAARSGRNVALSSRAPP